MVCHPRHITSLSFDNDGWIKAPGQGSETSEREEEDNIDKPPIEITPGCKLLLKYVLKIDLSSDLFNSSSKPTASDESEDESGTPLEELPHDPNFPNSILKVIAEVRRLGSPNETDKKKKDKKEGGQEKGGRRNRRGRNGKVAQLEEQRRLRQEQEQQKLEEKTKKNDQGKQVKGDDAKAAGENKNGDEKAASGDDEGFAVVGDGNDQDRVDESETPVELRLAAVFNTLRILITLLRPMLDHPKREDFTLQMKSRSSIKKGGKFRYYLFSQHVYACLSQGSWHELNKQWKGLLDEMREGLLVKLSKTNDDGTYELDAKDFVISLFNHEFYMNQELVAEKCIGSPDPAVASKVHDALINRFENGQDDKQRMLHRAIEQLQDKLYYAISRRFNGARLTVYGSCLSGLALQGSHDVDVSIYIPELFQLKRDFDKGTVHAEEYEKRMRRIIYKVRDALEHDRSRSFVDLFAITRARVPVVKGSDIHAQNPYTEDGSLTFDLCFLNDIAVVNSSLLREYSLFDNRVRILMLSVKSFAKSKGIASAADGTLSSYSWLNLVVFYLQCIGFLPVLQCPQMMEEHDFKPDQAGNRWHCVNGLETFYLTQDLVAKKGIWNQSSGGKDANAAMLLYGFFNFYSNIFPQQTVAASIRFGKPTLQKASLDQSSKLWRICVEDPFETCNSHCPHDLGCHVKEDGQRRISEHLARATEEFGEWVQQPMESDERISLFLSQFLGPNPKSNGKKNKGVAGRPQHQPQNASHQGRGRGNATRHNNRNTGPKGRHSNNSQYNQNRGQTQNSYNGGRGKNDGRAHQQKSGGQFDKTNHGNTGANKADISHQRSKGNTNLAANDNLFVEKQAERLRQIKISKENSKFHPKHKVHPRENGKGAGNDGQEKSPKTNHNQPANKQNGNGGNKSHNRNAGD